MFSVFMRADIFVWLPTGFGKTVCFEVLPFMFDMKLGRVDSLVVVVSPLVSLMIDQVRSLRSGSDRVWRDTDGCTALLGAFQGGPGQQQDLIALMGLTAESFQVRNCSLQCLYSSFAPLCWGKPSFTATLTPSRSSGLEDNCVFTAA